MKILFSLKNKLPILWYSPKNWLSYSLLPFSWIYYGITIIRRYLIINVLKNDKKNTATLKNIPVIMVGNITVGGTGKTPFVIWLSTFLKAQGYHPGIVSRGYGGKSTHYPCSVTTSSDPTLTGDEAILLAQRTACPVVIAPDRLAAAQYLIQQYPDCNVIISDDGLQHYYLPRNIEIVLIDNERGFGNQFYLPAGPLRESVSRLNTVDFVVINTSKNNNISVILNQKLVYTMHLLSNDFYNLCSPELHCSATNFQGQTVHAIASIGDPERFFTLLTSQGLSIYPHKFPDHYLYKPEDIVFDPVNSQNNVILMTEKDAVKCRSFADYQCWYLPVFAEITGNLGEKILQKLEQC